MANALFGWNNQVDLGTLTDLTNAAAAGLDVSQLQNDQGAADRAWQTQGGVASLLIDSGSPATTWRAFLLARANLSPTATVRWRVGDITMVANGSVVAATYDSGTVPANIKPGYLQSATVIAPTTLPGVNASVAGEFCRLDVNDPANPQGFINLPLVYAGDCWQPLTNLSFDTKYGRDTVAADVKTRSGAIYALRQSTNRRVNYSLQGVRVSEAYTQAWELDRYSRLGGNCLLIPDPAGANINVETIFGQLAGDDVTYPYGGADRRAWTGVVTERL